MSRNIILVLAIALIGFYLVEAGKNSNSDSADNSADSSGYKGTYNGVRLSSAERKFNSTCTSNYNCKNYEYGLECINSQCVCPPGTTWASVTYTYTKKRVTKTETKRFCELPFDAACRVVKYDRCSQSAGLACDSTTLKCACKSGLTWDGSVCA